MRQLTMRHAPFKRVYAICHSCVQVVCALHGGYALIYRVRLSNIHPPIHSPVNPFQYLDSFQFFFLVYTYDEISSHEGEEVGVDVITANTGNPHAIRTIFAHNLQRTSTKLAENSQEKDDYLGVLG